MGQKGYSYMKVTIEIGEGNRSEAITCIKGMDYFHCLWDLDQDMRTKLKHDGHGFNTPEDVMEYVREFINNNVDLTEIE